MNEILTEGFYEPYHSYLHSTEDCTLVRIHDLLKDINNKLDSKLVIVREGNDLMKITGSEKSYTFNEMVAFLNGILLMCSLRNLAINAYLKP